MANTIIHSETGRILRLAGSSDRVCQDSSKGQRAFLYSCERCGKCCKEEICQIGELVFGDINPPCPALTKENKLYSLFL